MQPKQLKGFTYQQASFDPRQVSEYIKILQEEQRARQQASNTKTTTTQKGRGGFLTSLISEGGAGAGAAVGSLLGPLGTIAGAGIGGFLGRLGENKVRDNRYGLSQALQEGATSAAFSGLGEGFKALKGARSAKGLTMALGGTDEASQLVKGAGKSVTPGLLERKGLDKVAQAGGYFPKDNVPGIGKITTNEVNKYYDLLKKLKISPNDAGDLEKKITPILERIGNILEKQLANANKSLTKTEVTNFANDLLSKVNKTPGLTSEAKKFAAEQIKLMKGEVKDLSGIHKFRVQLDNVINWNANPDSAMAAQQGAAKVLRDGIRNKLNAEVKGLAQTNNLYHDLTDIQKLTLRAVGRTSAEATSSGGSIGARILSSPTANTLRAKSGALMKEVGPYVAGTGGPVTAATNQLFRQSPASLARAISGAMQPQDTSMGMDNSQFMQGGESNMPTQEFNGLFGGAPQTQQPQQVSPYSLQAAMADIQRDPKHANDYMKLYDFYSKATESNSGQYNSSASAVIADTTTALQSLRELQSSLSSSGVNSPIGGRLRGLNPYDTEAQNLQAQIGVVKQIVGKALEGGVLRKEDEVKYAKILPKLGDSEAVAQSKITQLINLISSRLDTYKNSINGGGGGTDLSSLLQQVY